MESTDTTFQWLGPGLINGRRSGIFVGVTRTSTEDRITNVRLVGCQAICHGVCLLESNELCNHRVTRQSCCRYLGGMSLGDAKPQTETMKTCTRQKRKSPSNESCDTQAAPAQTMCDNWVITGSSN